MPKNNLLIQAKIYDIKSQILLLKAAQGGSETAAEEIAGAVGVSGGLAEQIEFQETRVALLEECLELDEAALEARATRWFEAWIKHATTAARTRLDLYRYALGYSSLEEWMIAREAAAEDTDAG